MTLYDYFSSRNPTFPVRVVGSGSGRTSIPKGTTAVVHGIVGGKASYRLTWDAGGNPEDLVLFGTVSMDLEILDETEPRKPA